MGLRIFLSYGHDEHASTAERIKAFLEDWGHAVWFDRERLKPGCDWELTIEQGLNWVAEDPAAARVVLVMTPHSVRRPDGFCLNEIARALERRLPIVPVMLVLAQPPLSISRIQWLDLTACVPLPERQAQFAKAMAALGEALESGRSEGSGGQARLIGLLEPLAFDEEIGRHGAEFTGRAWVMDEVEAWLTDPSPASRVLWIVGAPGIGKTAIAVRIATTRPEIAAWHFCRFGHVRKSDPSGCVTSIAYQLAAQLPDYFDRLSRVPIEVLLERTSDPRTLFDELIVQPLFTLPNRRGTVAVVIDALDEATKDGRNDLAALIADFDRLPDWFRLIVTSRRTSELQTALSAAQTLDLGVRAEEGRRDVTAFLRRELAGWSTGEEAVDRIAEQADGNFLYAQAMRGELLRRQLPPDLSALPRELAGIYADFFRRQFPDIADYKRRVRPLLEIVAAAQGQLPLTGIARLLDLDPYEQAETVSALGAIYQTDGDLIRPFHKSFTDWITDGTASGPYWVSAKMGHSRLADLADSIQAQTLAYSDSGETGALGDDTPSARKAQLTYVDENRFAHLIEARRFDDFRSAISLLIEDILKGDDDQRRQKRATLQDTLERATRHWPLEESIAPLGDALAAFAAAGSRMGHYGEKQYVISRALDAAVQGMRLRPDLAPVIPAILQDNLLGFLQHPIAEVDMAAYSTLDCSIRRAREAIGSDPSFSAWAARWDAYLN